MASKYSLIMICAVLGAILLRGSVSPAQSASPASSLGHWEVVRQIDYDDISEENLKGDIAPAYRIYLVSLAGFHSDTFGIAVGPDDDVRYTSDGGQSWTKAAGELYCRHGLEIVDESVAWHCGNGGTRVSTNGGQTWKTVTPSQCPFLNFLDAETGWAASPSRLQNTTDGGMSWDDVPLPLDAQKIAGLDLRTANDGYLLSTDGNLYVTADGGRSWEGRSLGLRTGEKLMTAPSTGPYAVMRFLDARHGMVIFALSDRTVWYAITEDGGQNWQRAEISELRDQSTYYHLFLSQDAQLLTVTDHFLNGENRTIVLRYRES